MAFTITYENKSETFEKKVKLLDLTNNNKDYICALVNGQLRELDYDVYYDANIQFWARDNKVRIITTIPSIVQHLEGESFFNANRNHGGTVFYDPDPCKSKWGSDIVTHWEKLK